jgi:uncharacterized protein (DUF1810 family)
VADADLNRFVTAQAEVHARVIAELTAGEKQSHWMWFVFPQLAGLGHSPMALRYAIAHLEEARKYLADPLLGKRLRDNVRLVLAHRGKSAHAIFGSPDDLKFRSCLTLFREAAGEPADRELFVAALAQFYGGHADPRTLELLRSA